MENERRSPTGMIGRMTMNQITMSGFAVAGFALLLPTSASSQQPAQVRVRGTVETVDGAMLTVKSRDHQVRGRRRLSSW
jgi:hypothetical protein